MLCGFGGLSCCLRFESNDFGFGFDEFNGYYESNDGMNWNLELVILFYFLDYISWWNLDLNEVGKYRGL